MKFAINLKSKIPQINKVSVLGPVLAPIFKIKNKYRTRLLLRSKSNLFVQKEVAKTTYFKSKFNSL